jgi:hypothetical protein
VSLTAATALLVALAPATQAKPPGGDLTEAQQRSLAAGIQVAPKGSANAKSAMKAPNPYLANLPDAKSADYSTWKQRMTAAGQQRAKSAALAANRTRAAGRALSAPFVHDEQEPTDDNGSNDSRANAEPVSGLGTGARQNPRVRILGSIADLAPDAESIEARPEDNGAIGLATDTGIDGAGAITTESFLGDGPHGGPSGSNDFDFYALSSLAGLSIIVDTTQTPGLLDTVVAIYNESGELLAVNDDAFVEPNFLASRLSFPVSETGRYFVLVAGFSGNGSLPEDPFDSRSGAGDADEGDYALSISSAATDTDYFALRLKKGDVIGAVGKGVASTLTIWRPDGTQMVGSPGIDLSFVYAPESPLPGGGNTTLAYVAERTGSYAIQVDGAPGSYDTLVEAYRPGSQIDPDARMQTIFLDFDGARVNTGIFGGPGVRDLSSFGAFLGRWDLDRAQQATMINKITAGVRENVRRDLIAQGSNPNVAVRVINSKDNADIFGEPNVSRVIVGGTIEESGIPTLGIAEAIDPGNYGHEDSALVLLDVLSGPADDEASLNHYLRPGSNRVDFVATAVANVISHEIGHTIGNYHTDEFNDVHHLVDAGGVNFGANLYGVGPDRIGGTADDEDIDFGTDTYSPFEGFTGQENALNVAAWAFVRSGVVAQP